MKATKYIFSTLVFTLLMSCGNEGDDPIRIPGSHLSLESVEAFMPEQYLPEGDVEIIFVNESGTERTLHMNKRLYQVERVHEGDTYTSDQIEIGITDSLVPDFLIKLGSSSNYYGKDDIAIWLKVQLMPRHPARPNSPTGAEGNIDFQSGEPDYHRHTIEPLMNINGQSFSDVFLFSNDDVSIYTEIYYNSNTGVVGFRDDQNELWSFKEFKD